MFYNRTQAMTTTIENLFLACENISYVKQTLDALY